ncbi:hypothetical protein IVA88_12470 [Bradyrhizobium sp. 149]|uniref:hypothetical protein n=1 Tax=Bradyrhizobium sp. 149 TaxID=2782624 RepID=UPI001FF8CACC|nr:hypothetical protein [Bradyrhizobium sp. 149]MCK1652247.1 hypothetical protein [Bradyrhizobium sp. 149]
MMIQHSNPAHQATCVLAEGTRQQAIAAAYAAGGGSAAIAAAIKTSEISFYRSVIASCVANGQPYSNFTVALLALCTGGA